MTAEQFETLQSHYVIVQKQLDMLYSVMLGIMGLLFAFLFSKLALHARVYEITLRVVRMVSDMRAAKHAAEETGHKLDDNAQKIQQKVDDLPQKVVQQLAESVTPSAADGDLPAPKFPER